MGEMMDENTISAKAAVEALPEGDMIHTFRNPTSTILLGADWDRDKIVKLIRDAEEVRITGEEAQGMQHGLAVADGQGWLFVETAHRTDAE